ncbi:MFS multidrug transporter [Purpureocillium lilacinum]|uniref:MFS multidrug transporter n=1 Tax=Purpureocillium lilacinum TaxID=33203 RepID=A0A179HXF9_PURLI|nr:MFS multidrug transporter [Purpureocillium lilacinum]OAQ94129.1 MFS multidrug transporter [Purpureocillium lilacinum]
MAAEHLSTSSLGHVATSEGPGSENGKVPEEKARFGGVRRTILFIALLVSLLFSSLDTSIVSTALITISHELDDFVNAPWIVLAYLLTYMGFAVCISKLSDIYGRRNMLILSWILFISFSLGCALSKNMTTLIICRAFQGIGASGMYSLTQIALMEVGPVDKPALIGAAIGATLATAFVLGPLLGGVITHFSNWKWIFYINLPCGLVTLLPIAYCWPAESVDSLISWRSFTRIDFLGSASLFCSSSLLIFAIQQAGSETYAWDSDVVIAALTLSSVCCVGFVAWETFLSSKKFGRVEPIFPMRLVGLRVYVAGLFLTLLAGFPYISLSIVIPERFQIAGGDNVLMAGVHLLPLLVGCALGSFIGGAVSSKRNNTGFTLVGSACFQLLGVGLLTTVTTSDSRQAAQYGYQAIFGLGVGMSFSAATIMTSILAADPSVRASAQGAIAQARVFGGCIGLAICTVMFNDHVNSDLGDILTPSQIDDLLRSPLSSLRLPEDLRKKVTSAYVAAFGQEVQVMMVVCAAMVIVSLFTLERHPTPLENRTAAVRLSPSAKGRNSSTRSSDSHTEMYNLLNRRAQTC